MKDKFFRNKTLFFYKLHKWTGIVSAATMLILCATGIILLFGDDMTGNSSPQLPADDVVLWQDMPAAMEASKKKYPDWQVYSIRMDEQHGTIKLRLRNNDTAGSKLVIWEHAGQQLQERQNRQPDSIGKTAHKLHLRLNLGTMGHELLKWLCAIALITLLTGVLIYRPFMKKQAFGEIRHTSRRLCWADTHKFLGMAGMAWLAVLTFTALVILFYSDARTNANRSAWANAAAVFAAEETKQTAAIAPLEGLHSIREKMPHCRIVSLVMPTEQYPFYGAEVSGYPLRQGNFVPAQWYFLSLDGREWYQEEAPWIIALGGMALNLHLHNHDLPALRLLWLFFLLVAISMSVTALGTYCFRSRALNHTAKQTNRPVKCLGERHIWRMPVLISLLTLAGLVLPLLSAEGMYIGTVALFLAAGLILYSLICPEVP